MPSYELCCDMLDLISGTNSEVEIPQIVFVTSHNNVIYNSEL